MSSLLTQSECLGIALWQRDEYTSMHCARVESLCRILGSFCDLSSHERSLLPVAAKLHDLGKIGITADVLFKDGPLDAAEWEVMKRHSELGQTACDSIPHPHARSLGIIVRHHHEAFDGSGYPDGLVGTAIPICSRIILLADCYDAMTSARSYRHSLAHQEAMQIMHSERGKKSDPLLFDCFARMMETRQAARDGRTTHASRKPLRGSA
ncbi:MAG: HD domain-containing phosphohydrolase [Rhodanobacteraceae bacterium]